MKPNLKHIFICIFVTLSIGCTNNNSFNIQGELTINNQNLTFINNELNNILLRRDDVFIIKNNSISLGYSNIDDNKYFLEGDNNKIKVLNEGKYNIKIIDNKLYFTKIDSSFSNIELHISDEENYQFIKNDDFHYYKYLMVHPNRETYFLFIDSWSQQVVRIYINDLLSGDYYVGKYDQIFVLEKRKDFFKRMIKNCDKRIEELKSK